MELREFSYQFPPCWEIVSLHLAMAGNISFFFPTECSLTVHFQDAFRPAPPISRDTSLSNIISTYFSVWRSNLIRQQPKRGRTALHSYKINDEEPRGSRLKSISLLFAMVHADSSTVVSHCKGYRYRYGKKIGRRLEHDRNDAVSTTGYIYTHRPCPTRPPLLVVSCTWRKAA